MEVGPHALVYRHGELGEDLGPKHVDDHGDGRQAGRQPNDDQNAADDFEYAVGVGPRRRIGQRGHLGEASWPEFAWIHEFLDPLGEKDSSDHDADQDCGPRRGGAEQPQLPW